jgi:NAD(P)-dependent dehydrogenase (short-subunit alcohol dehydrogenase family)
MEIAGKKAVVVGGASGMARATAVLLSGRGATVAILDLPGSGGSEAAADIGGATTFHPCDITDFEGTEAALSSAIGVLGGLHVAVNTAGGGIAKKTLSRSGPHALDDFRRVIDLNLVATFNLNRLEAAAMADNEPEDDERGVIVNTSSIAAFEGQIGQVAYAAAKAGIVGMTFTMARELGSYGIRVDAIAPSLFLTGITSAIPDDFADKLTADAAFPRRMGRPEEYAKLVASIIDNPMLNGGTIRLDAGQRFAPK